MREALHAAMSNCMLHLHMRYFFINKSSPGLQAGICMVGLSSILSGGGSETHVITTGDMLLGMGLVVASQARPAAPPGPMRFWAHTPLHAGRRSVSCVRRLS